MLYFFKCHYNATTENDRLVLDLISLGIVCEDGREFYAEREGFDWATASEGLTAPRLRQDGEPLAEIKRQLRRFMNEDPRVELWALDGTLEAFTLLTMLVDPSRPSHWPRHYRDVMDLASAEGLTRLELPRQPIQPHDALEDAEWCRHVHDFIVGRPAR